MQPSVYSDIQQYLHNKNKKVGYIGVLKASSDWKFDIVVLNNQIRYR